MKKIVFLSTFVLIICSIFAQNQDKQLLDAIKSNYFSDVESIVNKGVNLNTTDENGATALMWAVYKSDLETVKFLKEKGADVRKKGIIYLNNDKTKYYGSLCAIAAAEGKLDILKYLLEECNIPVDDKQLNIQDKVENSWTALQCACYATAKEETVDIDIFDEKKEGQDFNKANQEIIEYLIEKGANINQNHTQDKATPLILAMQSQKESIAKLLIEKGADLTLKNIDNNSALHFASMNSNWSLILPILQKNENPNQQNNLGFTPLMYCVSDTVSSDEQKIIAIRLLYTLGADLSLTDKEGRNVLSIAKDKQDEEIINYLKNPSFDYVVLFLFNREKEVYDYVKSNKYIANQRYIQNYSLLDAAALKGESDLLRYLMSKGEEINTVGFRGMTALMNAAEYDHADALNLLIEKGADINYQIKGQDETYNGRSALHCAAINGYKDIIQILADNHAKMDPVDEKGFTPVMYAVDNDNITCVKLLYYLKADINIKNKENKTALDIARENNNTKIVKFLTDPKITAFDLIEFNDEKEAIKEINEKIYDVNQKNEDGYTLLNLSVKEVQAEVVNLLTEKNANPNIPNNDGWYPMHYAAKSGSLKITKTLIDNGAQINVLTHGHTPLMLAALNNNLSVTKLLMHNKADANLKNKEGKTALELAQANNATETTFFLANPKISPFDLLDLGYEQDVIDQINKGNIDINQINEDGQTLLQFAAYWGQLKTLKLLIEKGVDVNAVDKKGGTAIYFAIINDQEEIVEFLADKANINLANNEGWCPLHFAAKSGNTKLAKLLIENGAKIDVKISDDGFTPLMLSSLNNCLNTTKLLIYNKADANMKNNAGKTSKDLAHSFNATKTENFLSNPQITLFDLLDLSYEQEVISQINEGIIDINQKNEDGYTLLQFASYWGQMDAVKLLIEKGADINSVQEKGGTAICFALMRNKDDVVKFLANKCNLNLANSDGWYPLHFAAKSDKAEIVKLLIENKAKIDVTTNDKWTPLMLAAYNDNLDTTKMLINNNADASLKNDEGKTALNLALSNNSTKTANFLANPQSE